PQPADARLAAPLAWLDGDEMGVVHNLTLPAHNQAVNGRSNAQAFSPYTEFACRAACCSDWSGAGVHRSASAKVAPTAGSAVADDPATCRALDIDSVIKMTLAVVALCDSPVSEAEPSTPIRKTSSLQERLISGDDDRAAAQGSLRLRRVTPRTDPSAR